MVGGVQLPGEDQVAEVAEAEGAFGFAAVVCGGRESKEGKEKESGEGGEGLGAGEAVGVFWIGFHKTAAPDDGSLASREEKGSPIVYDMGGVVVGQGGKREPRDQQNRECDKIESGCGNELGMHLAGRILMRLFAHKLGRSLALPGFYGWVA